MLFCQRGLDCCPAKPAKGGVKAHILLHHDDYLPRYVLIAEAEPLM